MESPSPQPAGSSRKVSFEVPDPKTIIRKRMSMPTIYGLIIVFFFFSFCTISCGGYKLASITGMDLVIGGDLDIDSSLSRMGNNDNSSADKGIDPNPLVIAAFVSAVAGFLIFVIRSQWQIHSRWKEITGIVLSVLGAISLLLFRFTFLDSMKEEGGRSRELDGVIDVSFRFGFWAALLFFILAGVVCVLRLRAKGQERNVLPPDDWAGVTPGENMV